VLYLSTFDTNFPKMKFNSLIAAVAVALTASLASAQTAPAVAPITPAPAAPVAPAPVVDNTPKAETTLKKHGKKKAHTVSAKKHKAAKHKKKAAM
jgi:Skp family chaperone for outer membrane proteins